MTEQELLDLKQEINEAKQKKSTLEGKQEYLLEELKKKWGCKTTEEADAKLMKMKKEIEKYNTQIEEKAARLEQKLEENEIPTNQE
jgi:predicted  nucleic acid-binding Zn-ribbon protein